MLFNSNAFYIFLPIVFAVYWITPRRYRWGVLLVSGYYFYMSAETRYIFLILLTTIVSYSTALVIERADGRSKKNAALLAALFVTLGVLFFFKYFNFFAGSVAALLKRFSMELSDVTLELVLPVGISFYTFQSLGYVIDVYRGKTKACLHFGKYAAFVAFFPLMLAGPIERADHLIPQIDKEHSFNYERAVYGAKLIAWGYFKKLAVADVASTLVDAVYGSVDSFTGSALAAATVLYALQVYCDFSGYSDIARGVANLLDIDLVNNFKSPYFASSIKEFWSRWHISLSTWFRDYIYFPLGGSRKGELRTGVNLMAVFLVSGLWHGAGWTYVLWGAVHGLARIIERGLSRIFHPKKERGVIRILLTFAFVTLAWILFRAETVADAGYVITHLFEGISNPAAYLSAGIESLSSAGLISGADLKLCVLWIALLLFHDFIELKQDFWAWLSKYRRPVRYAAYFALLFIVLYSRKLGEYSFVYFQF